ncbi:type I-E CRISPR-associated protein Cse1/CasA [Tahibacter sp.]|uniref:type I-E CRISPR-associated protein Cse1/CasA n=1 Tax=Tahibacter sp. TaxID=2056211 RepID=UPI0028C4397E|nr:type I-E CRISPR-associated protein Cse1/CasA [Tahibacter sp.]
MNLLFDTWIPVITRSGARRKVAPVDLTDGDDPPVELAAVRHDFDGALAQFLIGVFQSFLPPRGDREWERRLREPPHRDELLQVLGARRGAFELFDAEHPFLQDTSVSGGLAEADAVSALLIDAPGGNTLKENKDIFVKRGKLAAFAPDIAAQALLSLQINAPSGGVGYRTGLRGGGPLSTLVWPRWHGGPTAQATTLWEKVWLNVLKVDWEDDDVDWAVALPWLRPARTSRKGDRDESIMHGSLRQGRGVDPLCYWASPRRIRLLRGDVTARCDLSDEVVDQPVIGVLAQNYGPNYPSDRFEHPLSPYFRGKDDPSQWLPLHPRGSGLGFRDWPTLCADTGDGSALRRAAANVRELSRTSRRHSLKSLAAGSKALWAFGYELDNAKVLTWQESELPLFPEYEDPVLLAQFAGCLVAAAESARSLLRGALKEVFGSADTSLSDAAERLLFDQSEPAFYAALNAFVGLPPQSDGEPADRDLRERWASTLRHVLLHVFDSYADSADVIADTRLRHVKLVAQARGRLLGLWQSQYRKILSLPVPDDGAAAVVSRQSRSGA